MMDDEEETTDDILFYVIHTGTRKQWDYSSYTHMLIRAMYHAEHDKRKIDFTGIRAEWNEDKEHFVLRVPLLPIGF